MAAVYTSITLSYLPKARVLAASVKRHNPEVRFYLVLAEPTPQWLADGIASGREPFDVALSADMLEIPQLPSWLFGHSLVEACTGVKAPAMLKLQRDFGERKILYLDPDIVVFSPLDPLFAMLDQHSILLTPHCSQSETELAPIEANEISSLAHGVYNLGFVGVAADDEGQRFAQWWAQRLYHFCHDDVPRGLFTDQRWIDLVPAQFDRVRIVRETAYNVASWNITQRKVSGEVPEGLQCDSRPLCFYHFSGMNKQIPEQAYARFAPENRTLSRLVAWYRKTCESAGEQEFEASRWHFDNYDNGEKITRAQRLYYRHHPELHSQFPNPFTAGGDSYLRWLETAGPGLQETEDLYSHQTHVLQQAVRRLHRIENSRLYKLYSVANRFMRATCGLM